MLSSIELMGEVSGPVVRRSEDEPMAFLISASVTSEPHFPAAAAWRFARERSFSFTSKFMSGVRHGGNGPDRLRRGR